MQLSVVECQKTFSCVICRKELIYIGNKWWGKARLSLSLICRQSLLLSLLTKPRAFSAIASTSFLKNSGNQEWRSKAWVYWLTSGGAWTTYHYEHVQSLLSRAQSVKRKSDINASEFDAGIDDQNSQRLVSRVVPIQKLFKPWSLENSPECLSSGNLRWFSNQVGDLGGRKELIVTNSPIRARLRRLDIQKPRRNSTDLFRT